jgi:hypothetical protein
MQLDGVVVAPSRGAASSAVEQLWAAMKVAATAVSRDIAAQLD